MKRVRDAGTTAERRRTRTRPGDPPLHVRGLVTSPGTRAYQVWYRNAAAFCTGATFNLTNAVRVQWTP